MSASIVSPEASRTPVAAPSSHDDLLDLGAAADLAALAFDQADEAAHQRARAAHGVVHAHALHERGDHAVDRARPERVAADEQRMEAERRAQPLVA